MLTMKVRFEGGILTKADDIERLEFAVGDENVRQRGRIEVDNDLDEFRIIVGDECVFSEVYS